METLRNGKFTLTLSASDLATGLKKTKNNSRNNSAMISISGLVSQDRVLQAMDELTRIDTSVITDGFPYPQIFVLINHILICDSNNIYEYDSGNMVHKLTVEEGGTWKLVDFIDYIYMSNEKVSVIREVSSGDFIVSDLPITGAMCNYNGQVLVGGNNKEKTDYIINLLSGSYNLTGSNTVLVKES